MLVYDIRADRKIPAKNKNVDKEEDDEKSWIWNDEAAGTLRADRF